MLLFFDWTLLQIYTLKNVISFSNNNDQVEIKLIKFCYSVMPFSNIRLNISIETLLIINIVKL